tara:strand:- start:177 stop:683 length:507 start_codon:yes stop_codon:yes gene_type:complete
LNIKLRALEINDLDWLFSIENNQNLWKYSNTTSPYSKDTLKQYILNSHRDIFEMKQLRLVVCSDNINSIGLIDLFDFRPEHRRVGVGLIIDEKYQNKGIAKKALELIEKWSIEKLQIHQLFSFIAEENHISRKLFKSKGYLEIGCKIDWNFYNGRYNNEVTLQKILNE